MEHSRRITDLVEALDVSAITRALENAYLRGFQDGKEAFRKAVLTIAADTPADHQAESRASGAEEFEDGKRAPRGLTRAVITGLLKQKGAMTMADIQSASVATDARVSPKTVYNELKREKDRLYRERNDLWSLIAERPVEAANNFFRTSGEAEMT